MSWSNYHGHCRYCDGKCEPEQYINKAKELNVRVLGMSSHAPVPFDTDWTMPKAELSNYLAEIEYLKSKHNNDDFTLLKSLEVDYIPGIAGPAHPDIVSANLDYIIGSVHYAGIFDSGDRWSIDNTNEEFAKGIKEIFGGDVYKAFYRYFNIEMDMCDSETPQIIGHLDKVKMHNIHKPYFDEKSAKYLSLVYDLFKLTVEKDIIVEINTKYFFSRNLLFPGKEHFKWMNKNKVKVTINSDAHNPDSLITAFPEVAEMLIDAGYKELWEWDGKGFAPFGFDKNGIRW